jgi:hypothetical protein
MAAHVGAPAHEIEQMHATYMYEYFLNDSVDLILRFMKSVIKNTLLSIETSSFTERIISCKYNTHIKFLFNH